MAKWKQYLVVGGTVGAAIMAVLAPVALAIHIASREATNAEFDRALGYALDVVQRSENTSDQILQAVARLHALKHTDPCGPESLALMRHLDLASSYIQALGRVEGTALACSSLGLAGAHMELGEPDIVHESGVKLRTDVRLPFTEDSSFLVVESGGYAAIIHKELPIDTALDVPEAALATYSMDEGRVLTQRGRIEPHWIRAPQGRDVLQFIEDGHVIVVAPSQRYLIGAVAALPVAKLDARVQAAAMVALPVGIAAGGVLALAVLLLARRQRAMPNVIRSGLRRGEFFLVYQPIVDLVSGAYVGAEALLRWKHGNELIRPDVFIPVAEDSGLIQRLTERVIALAARDASGIFARFPDFHIAINLSQRDLMDEHTLMLLDHLSEATCAGEGNLMVEATERGFTDPAKAGPIIQHLRAGGIAVAIDDFGTGYSSLSSLEALQLDYLKIDKSFIDTLGRGAATSSVVQHIIGMAKSLKLKMIAEGVETEAQAEMLRARGVQFAQGWLFGKPMPFRELADALHAQQTVAQQAAAESAARRERPRKAIAG